MTNLLKEKQLESTKKPYLCRILNALLGSSLCDSENDWQIHVGVTKEEKQVLTEKDNSLCVLKQQQCSPQQSYTLSKPFKSVGLESCLTLLRIAL